MVMTVSGEVDMLEEEEEEEEEEIVKMVVVVVEMEVVGKTGEDERQL